MHKNNKGRMTDSDFLVSFFISHLHVALTRYLPVGWAAGWRILLANSSSSDATQKDSRISTPDLGLISLGSASQVLE
jgi:hypothetical protein